MKASRKTILRRYVWHHAFSNGQTCSYYLFPTPIRGIVSYSLLVMHGEETVFLREVGCCRSRLEKFVRRLAKEGVTADQVGYMVEDALGQVSVPFA